MAESAHLEKMSLELKCPICLSLLSSAVSLTCNHVFCNLCISTSIKSASNCPVCKVPCGRRELRPAPHMDNLVSIYKSMKAASGVDMFITQNMPFTKEPGEDKQHEIGGVTDGQEVDLTINGEINKRKWKKKRAKVSSKAGNSGPKPVRPSFPAKKRVQVPHHSPLETPLRLNAKSHQEAEQTNNELKKDNPVMNKNCGTSFAPFFWLRDEEEDAEKSTSMSNADTVMLTPPVVPCFSDMKDSDDENPCNLTPMSGPRDAAQDANMFDSEMFEWTQVPCSPELCATPIKSSIIGSVGHNKSLEEHKLQSQEMTKNEKIGNKKSNKRGRKTSDITQRKRTKKNAGHSSSKESEEKVSENKSTSLKVKEKTHKGKKKLSLDTSATEAMEENVSNLAELSKPVIADCSALPVEKERNTKLKKTRARSVKTLDKKQSSCIRKAKTQKLITADSIVTELESNGADKTVCDLQKNSRGIEIKKVNLNDTKVRSAKKVKFMTPLNCMTKSADELKSVEQIPLEMVKNTSVERSTNGSSKSLNGILRKCEEVSNKIQCGFCQSAEDTEASGLMIHYLKGKPFTENYKIGSNIIHAHKNCIEWAPNVYFEDDTSKNLEAELTRSKRIKCSCCGMKGAALGCYEKTCRKSFHVPCAKLTPECRWDNDNFVMLCPLHASSKLPKEKTGSQIKKTKTKSQKSTSTGSLMNYKSFGKIVICCSGLTNSEKETISEFRKIPGVTLSNTWNPSVTHVIASVDENSACKRTVKFLKGILEGKWIVNINWIKACLEAKELINEQPYEIEKDIHVIKNGPRLGRLRLLNKQPKLFNGYEFYFSGDYVASYKGYLHDLVIAAGGTVLLRKPINSLQKDSPSTFIIYSLELPDKCNQSKTDMIINRRKSDAEALVTYSGAAVATNSWILNSIAACKLQILE